MLNQQSILLLLVGMGLGYFVAIGLGSYPNTNVGLDVIVKKLEQQRKVSPNDLAALSSPTNMMHSQHRDAAAALMLRGESSSILHGHRRASSGGAKKEIDVSVQRSTSSGGDDLNDEEYGEQEGKGRKNSELPALPSVHNKKHTFREQEDVEEDLSEAQRRFVETQKLLGSQSIPTPSNPHVMRTVSFEVPNLLSFSLLR